MKFAVLISTFLLPAVTFAGGPTPMRAEDGSDLSFLLKRYDGPIAILRRTSAGKRHIVPRTLQVAEVPVRRAANGLVERQQCVDAGYVPCPSGSQCCPAGATCGPGTCCPAGNLPCAGNCQCPFNPSLLPRSPRAHTVSPLLQAAHLPQVIAVPTLDAAQVGRNASLHSTETLDAAPSVKHAQLSLVSRPLANSARIVAEPHPRLRRPDKRRMPRRVLLLPRWRYLRPRFQRRGHLHWWLERQRPRPHPERDIDPDRQLE